MIHAFSQEELASVSDRLALNDAAIRDIIDRYGHPPYWSRNPCFETLVHIILEQQVSLASAKAALMKLKEQLGDISAEGIMALSNETLRACYVSRQKTVYLRCLAETVLSGQLDFSQFATLPDEAIRTALCQIKGVGNWTVDVFMMMALHRADLFPVGDIALVNSVRHEKKLPAASKDDILMLAESWRPNRTVAAFIFWHAYIKRRNIRF